MLTAAACSPRRIAHGQQVRRDRDRLIGRHGHALRVADQLRRRLDLAAGQIDRAQAIVAGIRHDQQVSFCRQRQPLRIRPHRQMPPDRSGLHIHLGHLAGAELRNVDVFLIGRPGQTRRLALERHVASDPLAAGVNEDQLARRPVRHREQALPAERDIVRRAIAVARGINARRAKTPCCPQPPISPGKSAEARPITTKDSVTPTNVCRFFMIVPVHEYLPRVHRPRRALPRAAAILPNGLSFRRTNRLIRAESACCLNETVGAAFRRK